MDQQYYRLFVLGAGFSRPADFPLSSSLLHDVRDHVRHQFRVAGWNGTLEQDIEDWQSLYPGERLDLERVLAHSHRKHYLRLVGSDEYFAHGSRTIAAARKAIQRILIKATPIEAPPLYEEFARRLCPNDVVLTFNYDTLLEHALDAVGKSYTLSPEWWLKDNPTKSDTEPRYVDVLKLHGSVDWYDRHYHDLARRWYAKGGHSVPDQDPLFGPSPRIPTESLAKGTVVEEFGTHLLERVFRVPNHTALFPIGDPRLELVPFILPVADDKLLGYEPILDLWENLHRLAESVSTVIVIGYSMPSHDRHAYEALGWLLCTYQRAAATTTRWGHRRDPIQVITQDDSSREALACYPFLRREETRVWHEGFSAGSLEWIDWGDGAV